MTTLDDPLRIIAFGAHPDDCEIKASGVAARWAAAGHEVKFVSLTNGDIGHFGMAGAPLARRRRAEVERCAEILGIETEVVDIHDGELMPTLENRKTVARLIRAWQADLVLAHRPCDYHPDHRSVGILVQDTSVLVAAPFFTSDTPPVEQNPVYLFYSDTFQKPYPFDPSVVVSVDEVADKKWACLEAMPSQTADADAWLSRYLEDVPDEEEARRQFILNYFKQRSADVADRYREQLVASYGEKKGRSVQYAEAFEVCQYGRQPSPAELEELFLVQRDTQSG